MIKTTKINKDFDEITDILCDSCGASCKKEYGMFACLEIKHRWEYASNHDLEEWSAQICEECVETKLNFINFQKKGI